MGKKTLQYSVLVIMFGLIIFGGCARLTPWPNISGFLNDYKGMYRSEEIEGMFVIKHPKKRISDYSKFLIEPTMVYLAPTIEIDGVNEEVLRKVALNLHDELTTAFANRRAVVKRAGTGVLRIRVAITDVLGIIKEDIEGGVIEIEFIDSRTGERIAAILQAREGLILTEWAALLVDQFAELKEEKRVYTFER